MDLLLIHPSFPGQFRDLLDCFLRAGHRVRALGSNRPLQQEVWEATGTFKYHQLPQEDESGDGVLDPDLDAALRRGVAVAALAEAWRVEGYRPEVIVAMSAWGDSLHLRSIWPQAALVAYPELWASAHCLGYGFDPQLAAMAPPALQMTIDRQNLLAAAALAGSDAAVVPTSFQRASFPDHLQPRLQVIHEGINTERACPNPKAALELPDGRVLRAGDSIVTYASRSLEPLRGFRSFLEALPALLRAHPQIEVVIAGCGDGVGYGPASSHQEGHAAALLEELGHRLDPERVHLTGWLPHAELLNLFQLSAVHVHLTYPYTLSWSLLEAMACGVAVVGSEAGPVNEVIRDGENGLLVPFADPAILAARVLELLLQPERRRALGQAARDTVRQHYDLGVTSRAYLDLLTALAQAPRTAPANG